MPPDKAKSAPGDRDTQDGAAWASVPLNEVVELEVSFEGQSGNGCIANCVFCPDDPSIVEILTAQVSSDSAGFRIRGKAEGECSIVVTCDGAEIGWLHVVCYPMIELRGVVGTILTGHSRNVSYSAGALEEMLNRVYRQACIRITIADGGTQNLGGNAGIDRLERDTLFSANELTAAGIENFFTDGYGSEIGARVASSANDATLLNEASALLEPALQARYGADLTFFYVRTEAPSLANGSVPAIGSGPVSSTKISRMPRCRAIP